jgi:hypothetical protein
MAKQDYKYTFDIKRGKYIPTHRKVMEDYIGRNLSIFEIVHHKDGDKLNNNIENLQIVSREKHCELHHKDIKYKRRKEGYIPHNKISEELIKKIFELKKKGLNYLKISIELGISNMTVRKYILEKETEVSND